MTKADKARRLIEQYPTLSKKKLGELLYLKNPKHFKNAEDGRSFIRAVTVSKTGRVKITHNDIYKGVNLKEGKKNDFTPYVTKGKRIGLLFDIHIPYHDLKVINAGLSYFKKKKVDTIILGGDVLDFYQMSRYEKDPEERTSTWEELRMLIGFLTDLRDNFPKAEIIYKLGNHDERYEKYVKQHVELFDFPVLSLDYLINVHGSTKEEQELARKRNIKIISHKRVIKAGKLNVVHGHEFGKSVFSPVNIARGFYLRAKANTIGGHHHQTSEHIEKDLNQSSVGCWSVGCCCDLNPAYMPINKWNHGLALVEVFNSGDFSVDNRKVVNGKIM